MSNESRSSHAELGCGTLILIALIVMFFSNRNDRELLSEIKTLSDKAASTSQNDRKLLSEIETLTDTAESASKTVSQLRDELKSIRQELKQLSDQTRKQTDNNASPQKPGNLEQTTGKTGESGKESPTN